MPLLRFVILYHDYPEEHWDLMLENNDHLRTWKLLQNPQLFISSKKIQIKAQTSADHRLIYLNYEGPVSEERGLVRRIDYGVFTWLHNDGDRLQVQLAGQMLNGTLKLNRQFASDQWLLEFCPSVKRD